MRISVRHETTYTYGAPARSAMQLLRMTPRSFEGHFVRRWRVEVDTDARLDRDEDAYGNITHMVFVDGPVDSVRVTAQGEIDTVDMTGVVRGTVERLPLAVYLRQTALTTPTPRLTALAHAARDAAKGNLFDALHKLMNEINRTLAFVIGTTTITTTADEAYGAGRGVCQDFAHIFVAAARVLGIPARYVGGYYLRTDAVEQEAGHAWAEAFVENLGWIGFDPAHGVCVTDRYVRVAAGPDYMEAAPVRGARIGGAEEVLAVTLRVQQARGAAQA